ncbi:MAG: pyridoxal-phosphate dependent enzyme, partial [Thermodesulfobacteriota bacterium]
IVIGDLLVFGIEEDMPDGIDPSEVFNLLRERGGFALAAHPGVERLGLGNDLGNYPVVAAEVWNGRYGNANAARARELAEEGRTFIHPFDDPDIMAGQGTIGLEIVDEIPDLDVAIVPIGGGGLISGVASAVKALRPDARIIGVQAAVCPSAAVSRREGRVRGVEAGTSIADGITVKKPGERTFPIIQSLVDDVALVEEEQIAAAMLTLLERKKVLAEGSGAVPLAALQSGAVRLPAGSKAVLVISGGNVDSPLVGRILRKGLLKNGRIMRVKLTIDDIPGSLSRLLRLVARRKANVLHIFHDRDVKDLPVNRTYVELELETRGADHVAEVRDALEAAGYRMALDCHP